MKIYTKKGDRGETGLIGGERVRKNHPRIQAYGAVDETNSLIGWARSLNENAAVDRSLEKIQHDLFNLGALLAAPDPSSLSGKTGIGPEETAFLEREIDRMEADLPPLKNFILPGGSVLASVIHAARTVSRRAEREVVSLAEKADLPPESLVYLNRLSDYLFVLARWVNHAAGGSETLWRGK